MDGSSLNQVLANLVQQVGDAGAKYGPQALDLVGQYQHYMGIVNIITGIACFAIAAVAGRMVFIWGKKSFITNINNDTEPTPYLPPTIVAFLAMLGFGIGGLDGLLSPHNWVAAVSPKLALVQLAVDAVENHDHH